MDTGSSPRVLVLVVSHLCTVQVVGDSLTLTVVVCTGFGSGNSEHFDRKAERRLLNRHSPAASISLKRKRSEFAMRFVLNAFFLYYLTGVLNGQDVG